ncbi:kinase-like domain-containing protein [Rhizophagus irregularis DAOM 181602=DAOM 197198]|nr:kinase-like domain-containing protein [Rhizophagus irregularis DAOM 181602=DAOM 197198]
METCKECERPITEYNWCHDCSARHFQQNFNNWTSGNGNIDKFIQDTQLSAVWYNKLLEWIPFDRFNNIEHIGKGGFGDVYKAKWIDGRIWNWDNKNQNWNRLYQDEFVSLKSLNNSENITLEYIKEIASHHKINEAFIIEIYGITQHPETKNYMIVLQYAEHRSLRNYLNQNYKKLTWAEKIYILHNIANGLDQIHRNGLIHRNLHTGNILRFKYGTSITDIGLCKPADYNNTLENKVYGVLPYVAPEILRGQNYTKASDIYSFDPLIRPTADEIWNTLLQWYDNIQEQDDTGIYKQIEEINNNLSTNDIPSKHYEAIYTSRLLNFDNLPEPKNPDKY